MTGLTITPETLSGHAKGCASLAEKFGKLADLLHDARVDDECFGPIGDAVGISSKYFESLEECQQLATKAREFLQQTEQSLEDTRSDHEDNDQRVADLLLEAGKGLEA